MSFSPRVSLRFANAFNRSSILGFQPTISGDSRIPSSFENKVDNDANNSFSANLQVTMKDEAKGALSISFADKHLAQI